MDENKEIGTNQTKKNLGKILLDVPTNILKSAGTMAALTFASPYTVFRDVILNQNYANKPNSIFYDEKKPTPNMEDFPDGRPGPRYTKRLIDYLKKVLNH